MPNTKDTKESMKSTVDNCLGSTFSYNPTPDILKNKKPYSIHKTPTIMTSENEKCGVANKLQSFINRTLAWLSFQESVE